MNKNRICEPRLSRRKTQRRRGAATVEFAVIAPLMMVLTMGMIEVGRMVMVKQIMVNASREGARLGALPGVSNSEVVARVQQELAGSNVSGVQVNVNPIGLAVAAAGTPVTVSLSVPSSSVSWLATPMLQFSSNLQASTTMRRESD
ncbi:MAG: pilus assembly protein [Pirellulaceae bacterium]|nr:pilus assembly protein [Pirellulaceae bacterium]